DSVVAQSRGEDYDFTVTQTAVLPADDTTPTDPNGPPRLTLMTCIGAWDPLTRDYAERLWVIAEPADVAAAAIASNVPVIASPTPVPQPTPTPIGLLVSGGGLGDTDRELTRQFGPPTGQIGAGLAVYHHANAEYRVGFADVPDQGARRAQLVAVV